MKNFFCTNIFLVCRANRGGGVKAKFYVKFESKAEQFFRLETQIVRNHYGVGLKVNDSFIIKKCVVLGQVQILRVTTDNTHTPHVTIESKRYS